MQANSTIKDDIAYMRGLAEAGRKGPVLGASILFFSGLIYAVAAVASWLIHSGRMPIDLRVPGAEWWIAGVVQIALVIWMSRRLREQPRQANPSSRLFGIVWSSIGFTIFAFAFALAIGLLGSRFGEPIVWVAMPAMVMAVYGAGWSINAQIVRRPWMYAIAAISFVAAALTAFMVDLPDFLGLVVYAALILLVVCVPGFILMREGTREEITV